MRLSGDEPVAARSCSPRRARTGARIWSAGPTPPLPGGSNMGARSDRVELQFGARGRRARSTPGALRRVRQAPTVLVAHGRLALVQGRGQRAEMLAHAARYCVVPVRRADRQPERHAPRDRRRPRPSSRRPLAASSLATAARAALASWRARRQGLRAWRRARRERRSSWRARRERLARSGDGAARAMMSFTSKGSTLLQGVSRIMCLLVIGRLDGPAPGSLHVGNHGASVRSPAGVEVGRRLRWARAARWRSTSASTAS